MKKNIAIALVLCLSLSICACEQEDSTSNAEVVSTAEAPNEEVEVTPEPTEEALPEVEEIKSETLEERLARLSEDSEKSFTPEEMQQNYVVGDVWAGRDEIGYKFCTPFLHKDFTDENDIFFRQDFYDKVVDPEGVDLGQAIYWVVEAPDEDSANMAFWNIYMAIWNGLGKDGFIDTEPYYERKIVARVKKEPSTIIFALPAYYTYGLNRDGSKPTDTVPDWFISEINTVLDNKEFQNKYGAFIEKVTTEVNGFIEEYKPHVKRATPNVTTEKKQTEEKTGFTLENWMSIPENKKSIEAFEAEHTSAEGAMTISCKGNTMTIKNTFSKDMTDVLKAFPMEFLKESFEASRDANIAEYTKQAKNYKADGVEGKMTFHVIFAFNDGTEIWSMDVKP